jgi:predicted nucleic acid-binding protein
VTEAVLDASVVLKWFQSDEELNVAAAASLRADFQAGRLFVFAPRLLYLEVLNVAGRRWHWSRHDLLEVVRELDLLNFELREPKVHAIVEWTARGLTSYDASYVALAESESIKLITDDQLILAVAPHQALALSSIG